MRPRIVSVSLIRLYNAYSNPSLTIRRMTALDASYFLTQAYASHGFPPAEVSDSDLSLPLCTGTLTFR